MLHVSPKVIIYNDIREQSSTSLQARCIIKSFQVEAVHARLGLASKRNAASTELLAFGKGNGVITKRAFSLRGLKPLKL